MTTLDFDAQELLPVREWSAAMKRHKRAELIGKWRSGAYNTPDGRWNLAWDCGLPYSTANRWLRQELARQPARR